MVRFTKRYKYSRMNGGKKKRRKTQKNKRRKHRKGGMTFGKQKPLDSNNKPKNGDKVRVNGVAGYTVITPMNRQAEVCPPGKVDKSSGFAMCKVEPELVSYDDMTKHGFVGQNFPSLKKGGRKKRKSRKKSKRKRRKTKRRMKGGSAVQGRGLLASPACSGFNCDLPSNAGEIFTKYSNNNNPFFPDPMSLNRNVRNPISPQPMSGKKGGRRRRRKDRKSMKGGFFFDDWGLGDGLLAYYKGTNAALNTKHLYAGNKAEPSASPSYQPALLNKPSFAKTTPNVPTFYEQASGKAAEYRVNN